MASIVAPLLHNGLTMNRKPKTKALRVRVEPPLHAAIEHAAEQDQRTVSGKIRQILADWVAARGQGMAHTHGADNGARP